MSYNPQNSDVEMTSMDSKDGILNTNIAEMLPQTSSTSGQFIAPQQQQQQQQQQQPQTSQQGPQQPTINYAQKGQKLYEFIQSLEDYKPTVPDALTKFYMHTAGFDSDDPRLVRLVSILGQKFIADITNDALQHYKMRNAQTQHKKQSGKDKKYVLAYEDLAPVLAEYGIDNKKPQYFF